MADARSSVVDIAHFGTPCCSKIPPSLIDEFARVLFALAKLFLGVDG